MSTAAHRGMHRGAHPDDERLFRGGAEVERLRRAAEEVCWLLGRGWNKEPAVRAVANHHLLEERQRVALARGCCTDEQAQRRAAKALPFPALRGRDLSIDGFNLVIALEVALGGGVLVRGRDGGLRDLAGLRGSYHLVAETEPALAAVRATLEEAGVASVRWLLDRPVSNSGRLKGCIAAAGGPGHDRVELADDPDGLLRVESGVVSADAVILDGCGSWVNLHALVIERHVPGAWIVAL